MWSVFLFLEYVLIAGRHKDVNVGAESARVEVARNKTVVHEQARGDVAQLMVGPFSYFYSEAKAHQREGEQPPQDAPRPLPPVFTSRLHICRTNSA